MFTVAYKYVSCISSNRVSNGRYKYSLETHRDLFHTRFTSLSSRRLYMCCKFFMFHPFSSHTNNVLLVGMGMHLDFLSIPSIFTFLFLGTQWVTFSPVLLITPDLILAST